jgi:hypothetical protein
VDATATGCARSTCSGSAGAFHRIWSADWIADPVAEVAKVRAAYDAAVVAADARLGVASPSTGTEPALDGQPAADAEPAADPESAPVAPRRPAPDPHGCPGPG